jgi:hypothetical protein
MINKTGPHPAMEFYSTVKRNWVLVHATMWMDFKQYKKADTVQFHFCEISRIGKLIDTEHRLEVTRCWAEA